MGRAAKHYGINFAIAIRGPNLFIKVWGRPLGGFGEFGGGETTIGVMSFLRYHHPRQGVIPPRGHLSVRVEEQRIPPIE